MYLEGGGTQPLRWSIARRLDGAWIIRRFVETCLGMSTQSHTRPNPHETQCPISGLPVTRHTEWAFHNPKTDYHFRADLIGDRILCARASGHSSLDDAKQTLELTVDLVDRLIPAPRKYVAIIDFTGLTGTSLKAKHFFIETMRQRDRAVALIFYGLSPLVSLMIKLSAGASRLDFPVLRASDYSDALHHALETLGIDPVHSSPTFPPEPAQAALGRSTLPIETTSICPVTSLPVRAMPHWAYIDDQAGYSASVHFIGDRIACVRVAGFAGLDEIVATEQQILEVIDEQIPPPTRYIHIADYSELSGTSLKARMHYLETLSQRPRISAMVFFGLSTMLKLTVQLAGRVGRRCFTTHLANDYGDAVRQAVRLLAAGDADHDGDQEALASPSAALDERHEGAVSRPEWRLELDGFEIEFEILDGRILHASSKGYVEAHHLEQTAALRSRVLADTGGHRYPFLLMNLDGTAGASLNARGRYVESLSTFHKENPLEALVFYGASRKVRPAIALIRPFLPFRVMVADTREQAIDLTRGKDAKRRPRRRQQPTQAHVDDLIHYLGGIEWDQDGLPETLESSRSHPFRPVFEAIRLVKADLDQLLRDQRKAEETVRRSRQHLDALIEHLPEGVVLLDPDDRILVLNPRAERLAQHFELHGDDDQLIAVDGHLLSELRITAQSGWRELTIDGPDRCELEIAFRDVESSGSLLVLRDVTQERDVRQQLEQQERLAAVGQLASGIAHDFNNILQAIMLNADPLTTHATERLTRESAAAISEHSQRGARLIRQILDFSRSSLSSPKLVDFGSLLRDGIELLERTIPATIEIALVVKGGPYAIRADPTQMQQLVTNLALNARDAMPKGGRLQLILDAIEVAPRETVQGALLTPGSWVELKVSDSGEGIADENLPKIFEPFFTTKAPGEGTGLGLAQVYGIVQQHDGHIDCHSSPGTGSTFSVYFPRIDGVELETPPQPQLGNLAGVGQTILVVEDDPTIRILVARTLEALEYKVLCAVDGKEALQVFESEEDISLVISDVVMPGIGGIELQARLRKLRPEIKVLMMSGYPLGEIETPVDAVGETWIHKPFTMQELAAVVARLLHEPMQPLAHDLTATP